MKRTRLLGIWIAIGMIVGATVGITAECVQIAIITGIGAGLLMGGIIVLRTNNSKELH